MVHFLFLADGRYFFKIIYDHKETRDQGQGDNGGENDTKAQGNSHGDHEPRLAGGFKDHRRQAAKSCQRGEQYRTKTPEPGTFYGISAGRSKFFLFVGKVDKNQ